MPNLTNTNATFLNPLDSDPQTPLQHRPSSMPRAPPTPQFTDPLNLANFSEPMPITTNSGNPNLHQYPTQPTPLITSSSILSVDIHTHVKFQVTSAGANFSRWRQIFVFLLTMYKALDHITEGAAPAAPDDTWRAVDIHISLWIMSTLAVDLYRLVQGPDAFTTWSRLHQFFLNNQSARYLYLSKAL
jgi:hypothetical protein